MKQERNFAIGIPTLNRFDLLLPSLLLYYIDFPTTKIFIYDNGKQDIEKVLLKLSMVSGIKEHKSSFANVTVLGGTGDNIGVAGAWNAICREAYKEHTHVLMLNDDIYLGRDEVQINNGLAAKHHALSELDFCGCSQDFDWCAFFLPKKTWEQVPFDEKFYPAYYEDKDAQYRMALLGMAYDYIPMLDPIIHRKSMTLMKEPELLGNFKDANKKYYIKKWGGDVGAEKFKTPFNK